LINPGASAPTTAKETTMTAFAERTDRARTFAALVDASIRCDETQESYITARKAAAFQHIVEELARQCPEALAVLEDCFVPFYQRRLDAAQQKEAAE